MIATLSLALLLGSAPQAQDLTKKLDYEAAGIPATRVVEELAEKTGQRIAINPGLGTNPMVIKVKGVTLKDLMDRMAQALDATWSPDSDGTLRLVAVPVKDDSAKRLAARTARFAAYQAKTRKELAASKPFDRAKADQLVREIDTFISSAANSESQKWHEEGQKLGDQGPMSALAKRILVELDPKALASVEARRKTVWSSRPTRMQFALPTKALDAVRAFAKEYEVWTSAVGSRTFTYPQDRGLPMSLYYLVQNSLDWNDTVDLNASTNDLSKVLVFATSWSGQGAAQIQVKLVDKRGKYVAEANQSLDLNGASAEGPERNPITDAQSAGSPDEPDVKLKPVSQEIAKRFASMMGGPNAGGEVEPLSPAAENVLFNPEKIDPVSLGFPEFMWALHETKKVNVVASPPDFAGFYGMAMTLQGVTKASQFLKLLSSPMFGVGVTQENGWLVIGSKLAGNENMPPGLGRRMNRPALGQLLRQVKLDGMVKIEPLADFAYRTITDDSDSFPMEYVYISLIHGFQDTMGIGTSGPWLRLYGSLNPDQRRALKAGRLAVANLRPDQREMLEDHVYGANNYSLSYEPKGDAHQDWDLFHNGIRGEPTERYANGMPAQAFLTMSETNEDIVIARGSAKWGPVQQPLNASELANHLVSMENPRSPGQGDWEPPQYTSFEPHSRRQLTIRLDLDPEVNTAGVLSEAKATSKSVKSIDQLPEAFRTKVLAEKAKIIEQRRRWEQRDPPPPK